MAEPGNDLSSDSLREEIETLLPAALRPGPDAATVARRLEVLLRASTVGERIDAWVRIVEWSRPAGLSGEQRPTDSPGDFRRLEGLLVSLEGSARIRSAVHEALGRLLAETEGVPLFGETGLPSHRGFFPELGDRVMNWLLPRPREDADLAGLLGRLFPSVAHTERFRRLPPELFHRIVGAVLPPDRGRMWEPVRTDFVDGFRLLAGRARAEGLAARLRAPGRGRRISESPFFRLDGASEVVAAAWLENRDLGGAAAEWRRLATDCWAEMGAIRRRLETEGVSVDVVFGLDVIDRALNRMELMIEIMEAPSAPERSAAIHQLLARLVTRYRQDRSVRHLASANLRMLARRIVERSGQTGEHYIAHDRKEYRLIWFAAAGGGALEVITGANGAQHAHACRA